MTNKLHISDIKAKIKQFLLDQSKIRFGLIFTVLVAFLIGVGLRVDGFSLWRLNRLYEKINYKITGEAPLFTAFSGTDNSEFLDVWDSIRYEYLNDKSSADEKTLIKNAYIALVDSLNDKYTYIEEVKNEPANSDSGIIGILLGYNKNNVVEIKSIEYGSAAYIGGLEKNDIIIEVNDINVVGKSILDIKEKLSGPSNEDVVLKVYREKSSEFIEKTLTRRESSDDIVTLSKIDDGLYNLAIHSFSDDLYELFDEAISDESENIKKLIIDLRSNTGGDVGQAVQVISTFLNEGQTIFTQEPRNGSKIVYKSTKSNFPNLIDIPTVILVNSMTASCSEIMSLALRDNKNIKIIGENTYGKGVITREIQISDDEIIHLTTSNWYGPKNESIQEIGIKPDIITQEDALKEGLKILKDSKIEN